MYCKTHVARAAMQCYVTYIIRYNIWRWPLGKAQITRGKQTRLPMYTCAKQVSRGNYTGSFPKPPFKYIFFSRHARRRWLSQLYYMYNNNNYGECIIFIFIPYDIMYILLSLYHFKDKAWQYAHTY